MGHEYFGCNNFTFNSISKPIGVLVSCDRQAYWLLNLKHVPQLSGRISSFTQKMVVNISMREERKTEWGREWSADPWKMTSNVKLRNCEGKGRYDQIIIMLTVRKCDREGLSMSTVGPPLRRHLLPAWMGNPAWKNNKIRLIIHSITGTVNNCYCHVSP